MSTFINILLAFFGGVLATCMGALGSVVLCALVAMIGVCTVMAGCEFNVALVMGFGFFLSPHLGLGPAACALGFAKKKGYVEDSKGIALPLIMLGKPSVLVVGGLFGILSYYIKLGLDVILPGKIDAISAAIVIIGIIAKILFGNEGVIGKVPEGDKRFGVASKNKWMPHMPSGEGITYWLFAGGASLLAGLLYWEICEFGKTFADTNPALAENITIVAQFPVFALAVIFLILLCTGLPCPVFHHVGLVSCYGAMIPYASGANELVVLLWAMSCGILSHFVADLLADLFLVYGDGYVDPPSLSMAACSLFTWILFPALGLYNGVAMIVTPIVLLVISAVIACVLQAKRKAALSAETAA